MYSSWNFCPWRRWNKHVFPTVLSPLITIFTKINNKVLKTDESNNEGDFSILRQLKMFKLAIGNGSIIIAFDPLPILIIILITKVCIELSLWEEGVKSK